MDLEIVDIVDNDGRVLRQELKTDAHKNGWLHKTVIGFLKYGEDWALVEQAADRQDAGQLVAPVGGHVGAGETEIAALLRESEEEIGTRNIDYAYRGSAIFHRQVIGRDENHMFLVYEISTTDEVNLGSEAVAIERFTTKQLKNLLQNNPENFGDALFFVLEHFYPNLLTKNYINKWKK